MEEHVALDTKKQKKFVKSLKGIKKLMKKTGALPERPEKKQNPIKTKKNKKKKRFPRGLVYLSHIPHGFYEHQMTEYFKQFGMVTNARVIKSKHTGRSKGHAFVEFKDLTVAQVVAETMNNYLMGKRLIKAVYIPPKDQRVKAQRKNWNPQNNPGRQTKLKMKKAYNTEKTENEDLKIARKLLSNLTKTKSKLKELDIDYDFFTPVDVPEGLANKVKVKKEENGDSKDNIEEVPTKQTKKKNKSTTDETKDGKKKTHNITSDSKQDTLKSNQNESTIKQKKQKKLNNDPVLSNEKNNTAIVNDQKKNINKKNKHSNGTENTKETTKNKTNKKQNEETNFKFEIDKKQKLKQAGIKPLEDFISIVDEEDDDSDSTYEFDSDEYENEINAQDSDSDDSIDDNNDDDDSNEESDEDLEESDIEEKPVQKKTKKLLVQTATNAPKVKQEPIPKQNKRKVPEKVAVLSKKPRFEKQNNKKLPSKQLKKKK